MKGGVGKLTAQNSVINFSVVDVDTEDSTLKAPIQMWTASRMMPKHLPNHESSFVISDCWDREEEFMISKRLIGFHALSDTDGKQTFYKVGNTRIKISVGMIFK